MLIYLIGPDILSVIINGMPLAEGQKHYAGNGWFYVGRDLDFYLEGKSFFGIDSIWRLMPLKVVLPQIQSLIYIGIFQFICIYLLAIVFFDKHRIISDVIKSIDHSVGRSLRLGFVFIVCFGLILLTSEIIYKILYNGDLIFDYFMDHQMNQHKLNLHPIYFSVSLLVGCIGAAIFEETFFRRILFPLLRHKMPFLLSAILNATLFACMHEWSSLIFIQTFLCGFVSCVIFEKSKSIAGCIFFHFSANFSLLIVPLFYPMDVFY